MADMDTPEHSARGVGEEKVSLGRRVARGAGRLLARGFAPEIEKARAEYRAAHADAAVRVIEPVVRQLDRADRWVGEPDRREGTEVPASVLAGRARVVLAEARLRLDARDEAAAAAGEALELLEIQGDVEGQSGEELSWYGAALYLAGRSTDAIDILQRAIDSGGASPEAYVHLGALLLEQDNPEAAVQHFDEAVRQVPDDIYARSAYADALVAAGRSEEAVGQYRESASAADAAGLPEQALALYDRAIDTSAGDDVFAIANKGELLRRLGRFPEAREALDIAANRLPDDPVVLTLYGSTLRMLNEYDAAMTPLEGALELDFAPASYEYGELLRARGEPKAALPHLERAIESEGPDSDLARASLGATFAALERFNEALEALDQALEVDPDYAWALGHKGAILVKLDAPEQGIEIMRRALQLDPEQLWIYENLIEGLTLATDYEEAALTIDTALELGALDDDSAAELRVSILPQFIDALRDDGRYEEALERLSEAFDRLDPPWALASKGRLLVDLGRYAEALDVLGQAASAGSSEAWLAESVESATRTGWQQLSDEGHHQLALEQLELLQQIQPNNAWGLFARGSTLTAMGQYEEAEAPLRASVAAAEPPADALSELGDVLRWLDRPNEALKIFDEAITRGEENVTLMRRRGYTLLALDRGQEAVSSFMRALDLYPENGPVYSDLGFALAETGDYRGALEYYRKATDLSVDDGWTLASYGRVLLLCGEYETALGIVARAADVSPDESWILHLLGAANRFLGDREAEEAAYQRAASADEDSVTTRIALGDAFLRLGRKTDADEVYAKALERMGTGPYDEAETAGDVAWCRFRLGDHDGAVKATEEAISLDPELLYVRFDRALFELAGGGIDAAISDYHLAVKLTERRQEIRRRGLLKVALFDLYDSAETMPALEDSAIKRAVGVLKEALAGVEAVIGLSQEVEAP